MADWLVGWITTFQEWVAGQLENSPAILSALLADGIVGIDYSSSALKKHPEWILEAHKKGMIVNVWTVNSDFKYWIDLGVDVITTNESDALLTLLKQKK